MANINDLKLKYNELLLRFKKGNEMLSEHPEYAPKLSELQGEMENILGTIEKFTPEEQNNGFKIEEIKEEVIEIQENQLAKQQVYATPQDSLMDFNINWGMAERLAKSTIIPDNYRGKPENVVIAIGMAQQMGFSPFTVMQNLSIIKGKTSWSGSFCKTLIERTGKFKNLELNYIGKKGTDTYGCYLSATRVSDNKIVNGPEVTMAIAKSEGWTSNKKWITLQDLMLAYRCQSFFARVYCPEALNGIYTSEEIEDVFENNHTKREIEDVL